MRQSFVWHNGDWVDAGEYYGKKHANKPQFPTIITDSTNYQSMITGEQITSRNQHREHLKAHGYQEVGNEKPAWMQERDRMRSEGLTQTQIEAEEAASKRRNEPNPEGVTFEWMDIDG